MDWVYALGNWIADPDNLTAFSTAIIALFTAILVCVGYSQATLTRKAIDLGNKEFISTHRPKLRIRRITLGDPLVPNNRCRATIEVANVGETTATIVEFGVDIYGQGYPFSAAPQKQEIIVAPGKQASVQVLGQVLTDARVDAIELGTESLRILGIINYRDDNDLVRSTSFARIYDRIHRRFVTVPEQDQEADREFED